MLPWAYYISEKETTTLHSLADADVSRRCVHSTVQGRDSACICSVASSGAATAWRGRTLPAGRRRGARRRMSTERSHAGYSRLDWRRAAYMGAGCDAQSRGVYKNASVRL
eukprot:6179856-Pleurochrysis_carterae.AAC.6